MTLLGAHSPEAPCDWQEKPNLKNNNIKKKTRRMGRGDWEPGFRLAMLLRLRTQRYYYTGMAKWTFHPILAAEHNRGPCSKQKAVCGSAGWQPGRRSTLAPYFEALRRPGSKSVCCEREREGTL